MTFAEFIRSRRKRAILLFLAGFFLGGIIYYLCVGPAGDQLAAMGENVVLWAQQEISFWNTLPFIIWERGKIFVLLWLVGYTKGYKGYVQGFVVYAGVQAGFMLLFFVLSQGVGGLLLWLGAGIPHLLLLVPLYLYSFYRIYERRRERSVAAVVMIVVCFLASCLLEAWGNVPLMQWLYTK